MKKTELQKISECKSFVTYRHRDNPNGPRYRDLAYEGKVYPEWADDIQPVDELTVLEKIDIGYYRPAIAYSRETRTAYQAELRRLEREVFKQHALTELGLQIHPKADQIFQLAWDREHSTGLTSVFYFLQELSELFDPS